MRLKMWEDLPLFMQIRPVKRYYDALSRKRASLLLKRFFDVAASSIALVLLSPLFIILSLIVKADSKGPVFFRQIRVTQYGKQFKIIKFRTMVNDTGHPGNQITSSNDNRVTRAGKILRKYRLDEIPQLVNIITGDMSFVGTRPEVVRYVEKYTDEMMATLLLPAGVTSSASIEYRNEENLIRDAENVDETYFEIVLPGKMEYNLKDIENFSFFGDMKIIFKTVAAVFGSDRNAIASRGIKIEN